MPNRSPCRAIFVGNLPHGIDVEAQVVPIFREDCGMIEDFFFSNDGTARDGTDADSWVVVIFYTHRAAELAVEMGITAGVWFGYKRPLIRT